MVALEHYAGREQSYVKHVFLESYLERLAHKTASKYDHIVYVDGFAGPWQSATEKFQDTSFGIALHALRQAKVSWNGHGRSVRMTAHLVEKDPDAYKNLAKVPAQFGDVEVKTYDKDFMAAIPEILSKIPTDAFAFFLLDPKGWRIPLKSLEPLLERPNSEVIFNFMFDFINRAASMKERQVVDGLDELIPHGDWREKLEMAESAGNVSPERRKSILGDAFGTSLMQLGKFTYVAETTVLRPVKERPLYCLFYATRHAKGIEVFRDAQVAALREESKTRATNKVKHAESTTGQVEMFESLHDMAPDRLESFLKDECAAAEQSLLDLIPPLPASITYDALRAQVLVRHVVRCPDVNKLAARLRKEARIHFPDWEARKQVPQAHYRTQRK